MRSMVLPTNSTNLHIVGYLTLSYLEVHVLLLKLMIDITSHLGV